MARNNGGIIGKANKTSFGKCTVTSKTSSTPSAVTTQPGTRLIDTLVVAGGGGAGMDNSGGGGAGGVIYNQNIPVSGGSALGAVVIGAGAAPVSAPSSASGNDGNNSTLVIGCTTYTAVGGG
jgi:hypothetical protein